MSRHHGILTWVRLVASYCPTPSANGHTVYLGMMFFSYMIICLPTKWVMGTVVLVVTTILLPIQAPELNSAKAIFTDVGNLASDLCDSRSCQTFRPATMGLDGPVGGLSA
jgi:hypothetical protein